MNPLCTCSVWWVDPDTGIEYDNGGGDRIEMRSREPAEDCPIHRRTPPRVRGLPPIIEGPDDA